MNRAPSLLVLFLTLAIVPGLCAADEPKKKPSAPAGEKESAAVALPRVSAGDIEGVKALVGKKAVVFGKVISAREVEKSGVSFLDLDGGKLTVVCFKENYANFEGGVSPARIYKGKDIEVTGEIFEYRGKTGKGSPQPEIKLTSSSQVKVVSTEKDGDDRDDKATKPAAKDDAKKTDPKKVDPKKYFK
jgi:DNA/RNA endonuclease YhcR with UshA esterase domain